MSDAFTAVLHATLEAAPSLVFAATGAALTERAGVVFLGIEGTMRTGALVAAVVALQSGSAALGLLAGTLSGLIPAALHGLLVLHARGDQIVSGVALNLVALAGGTFAVEAMYGGATTPASARLPPLGSGLFEGVPLLGALGGHPLTTWVAVAVPLLAQLALSRTAWGLRIRAAGEKPHAVASLGLSVRGLRWSALLLSGALAGLGGATLSLAVLDRFSDLMPYGQGFVAIAAMIFGRWSPLGAAGAALFFAFADALRVGISSTSLEVPRGLLLALPYVVSLVLLAWGQGRARAPAALGRTFEPETRP